MKDAFKVLVVFSLSVVLAGGEALAGRGGGYRGGGGGYRGGGGFRGGGGYGGFRGGGGYGGYRGSMPSLNRPSYGGGAGARPQYPSAGYRPNIGQRPNYGGGAGGAGLAANRPNITQRPNYPGAGGANRPNISQRPNYPGGGGANRPNYPGSGGANRPNYPGGGGANRPNYPGGGGANRPNYPGNGNYPNRPGYRPGWPGGNPAWSSRPGWAYHRGWINGYWHGQNNANWWNNWGGFATGMALGGIGAWGIGSALWNWGYMPFMNPYAVAAPMVVGGDAGPIYDYSQPLNTEAPPPEETVADQSVQVFDAGRAAFMSGNYDEALRQTETALKSFPNDAAMHEFRALCLFALKRYEEAAGTLYAVLSAGPGWDWTTLVGLYPNVEVYTTQLRDLEAYINAHSDSAPARFVLAYHYLTQGHNENALAELKQVLKLQPADKLSAQIVAQLSGGSSSPGQTAQAPAPATTETSPVKDGNIVGTWKASPAPTSSIELTVDAAGGFRWVVTDKGKPRSIEGKYTYGNGILALSQNDASAMVGRVTWQDNDHLLFQAMGGGPNDPGLSFSR